MDPLERLTNLELQISEYELLKSMYPGDKEVEVEDVQYFSMITAYVESNGQIDIDDSAKLCIQMNMEIGIWSRAVPLTITATMSHQYPAVLPHIHIRSNQLSRTQETKLNEHLAEYMSTIDEGETCLFQVSEWVKETAESIVPQETTVESSATDDQEKKNKCCTFCRMWIYSHHIYNKIKRRNIVEWAKELGMTGFCMPGKPGIICVEGLQENCDDYWQRLRTQTGHWQLLRITDREFEELSCASQVDEKRRFHGIFEEKNFGVHGGRDYHMDLGLFLTFLTDHACEYMFERLFGVKGKTKDR